MIIVPITDSNPYKTFDSEDPYSPTPVELAVVNELIRQGAPQHVQFVSVPNPWYLWTTHLIRFIALGPKKFEAESYMLCAYPSVALNEMKSLGMVHAEPIQPEPKG